MSKSGKGCCWKIQAPNPAFDPQRPLSGPPRVLIKVPKTIIREASEAKQFAARQRAIDGLDWEPTPL